MAILFPHKYICIEGNIGSGKTSFSEMVYKEYQCQLILEEFHDNPFLPHFYQDRERYAFSVELFFMTERYKQLQQKLLNRGLFDDFTISDYSFIKSLLFAQNNLIEDEYRLFQKLWNVLQAPFPKPDLVVYLHRDISVLKDFIAKRGRDYEKLIKNEYLLEIQNTYFDYFRNVLSYPVVIVDLRDINFVDHPKHYETLKQIVAQKYRPGVHRISLIV